LLDQHILSGVGNVYRLEALFVNGIHPERPANTLSRADFDALWDTLGTMLRQGVEDRRIVTVHPSERSLAGHDGLEAVGPEDAFYVYHQRSCRRCGSPVRAWRVGGRPAYACERCQPPPGGAALEEPLPPCTA
jgi:endonuclease-8